MNPDFLKERSNASFSSKELEYWLDGGREKTDLKLKFQKIVEEDKAFDWKDLIHGDRNHVFKRGLEVSEFILVLMFDFWILELFLS